MILKRGLMQIVLAALLLAAQHGALTHHAPLAGPAACGFSNAG
jgi:hypothetical protein